MPKAAAKITGYDSFMQDVSTAKQRVLVLDYDGTIAPFSAHRLRAIPYPGVLELLRRIMADCRTRLIVATGRAAHEVIPLLNMIPPPEIWGTHGAERVYADGRYEEIEVNQDALEGLLKSETGRGGGALARAQTLRTSSGPDQGIQSPGTAGRQGRIGSGGVRRRRGDPSSRGQ
jgi:hypothetical protein